MLGWIGTHSTFPYLRAIFPVLQDLAKTHRFRIKIVGAGTDEAVFPALRSRIWNGASNEKSKTSNRSTSACIRSIHLCMLRSGLPGSPDSSLFNTWQLEFPT